MMVADFWDVILLHHEKVKRLKELELEPKWADSFWDELPMIVQDDLAEALDHEAMHCDPYGD